MQDTDYMMKSTDEELFEENEGRKILKEFLIADIKSKNTSYWIDYNDESPLDVFFLKLGCARERILKQALKGWEKLSEDRREEALNELRAEVEQEQEVIDALPVSNIQPTDIPNIHTVSNVHTVSSVDNTIPVPSNKYSKSLVSEKVDEFMSHKMKHRSRAGKPMAASTNEKKNGFYNEFIHIIGKDTRCCDLDKKLIKIYENAMWEVPKGFTRNRKFMNMPIEELISLGTDDSDRKSNTTIGDAFIHVKQFLKWAGKEEYIIKGLG